MKILYITQYYPPDIGAPSFRAKQFVKTVISSGHDITVYTSYPNRYKNIKEKLNIKNYNKVDKEKLVRTRSIKIADNILGKGISFVTFFVKTFFKMLFDSQKYDLIYVSSPPLPVANLGVIISKIKRVPLIVEIRDLWPETLVAIEKISKENFLYKIFEKMESNVYKNSSAIVTVSKGYLEHINKYFKGPIFYVPNGISETDLKKTHIERKDILKRFDLQHKIKEDDFIVSYIGNIGYCQNLSFVVETAKKLKNNIKICLFGDGSEVEKIKKLSKNINNLIIEGPFRKEDIGYIYHLSDVLIVHLKKNPYFKKVIPSKIFEYLLYQKPIIYGLEGEAEKILSEFRSTFKIESENSDELKDKILYIKENYQELKQFAIEAEEKVIRKYNMEKMFEQLINKLNEIKISF
mgnify:CR=1 FL=1